MSSAVTRAAGPVLERFATRLLLAAALLVTAHGTARAAAQVPWLYDVSVAVESQSAADRQRASSEALVTLLSRLTGLAHVPRSDPVREALAAPERYYSQFRYAAAADGALELVVQFDASPVLELVKRAELPIWRSTREQVLAWVVLQDGATRELLGANVASPVVDAMRARALSRGLPLTLPLLDLEDRLNVSEAAVWGRLTQVLEPSAERYDADTVLIGRATLQADGGWSSDWVFWIDGQEIAWAAESGDLAAQAEAVVDLLATELASRRAVLGRTAGRLLIAVSSLRGAADYGNLLGYLRRLEFVDAVEVLGVEADRVTMQLTTRATAEQLLSLLQTDGRLFENQLAITRAADLELVWRRP